MATDDEKTEKKPSPLVARIQAVTAWVQALKPVRVFVNYTSKNGPILASGLAYQALFAGFAALWVGFSIAGIVLTGNLDIRESLVELIGKAVPGLIKTEDGDGAIDPEVLLSSSAAFSFAAVVALIGLLITALGWLDSARTSVRTIFTLPAPKTNFLLLKVIDLAVGVGLGASVLLSLGLSVLSTQATDWVLALIGLEESVAAAIAGRVVTAIVMLVLNAIVLTALYRVLSGVRIPWRSLREGILFGAVGLTALQLLGSTLLGGANSNPLIAPFAVIAGLLIFFNFSCQVILIAASWIAIDLADQKVVLDEEVERQRLEEAQRLVAEAEAAAGEEPKGFFAKRRARRAARKAAARTTKEDAAKPAS